VRAQAGYIFPSNWAGLWDTHPSGNPELFLEWAQRYSLCETGNIWKDHCLDVDMTFTFLLGFMLITLILITFSETL